METALVSQYRGFMNDYSVYRLPQKTADRHSEDEFKSSFRG